MSTPPAPNKAKEEASRTLLSHGMTIFEIIREYWKGNYREVPTWSILTTLASLAYVVSPVDFLPELVLGPLGTIDDAFVLGLAIKLINDEIRRFTTWKETRAPGGTDSNGKIVDV